EEPRGDLGVAQPLGQEREHLALARGEAGRMSARAGPESARQATHALLAQPASEGVGGGGSAEALEDRQGLAPGVLVAVGEGEGLLVGAAEGGPGAGGGAPV